MFLNSMTTKNIRIALFGALIVAIILPFSGIGFATDGATTGATLIEKPVETQAERDEYQNVLSLVNEIQELKTNNSDLLTAIESASIDSLSAEDRDRLEQINSRLNEIKAEIGTINAQSRELYASTPEVKNQILDAKQTIKESEIPYHGLGTDFKNGALVIGFQSQEIADQHIPTINTIIGVPYYLEIGVQDEFLSCTTRSSNCDPLVGGIKISTQNSATGDTTCTYSIPVVRNVWWWTETGFVTAAHCFKGVNGYDTWQPLPTNSKIGDVTKIVWGGECDCAFSKKTGSESTTFGVWTGSTSTNPFTSKSDPLDQLRN